MMFRVYEDGINPKKENPAPRNRGYISTPNIARIPINKIVLIHSLFNEKQYQGITAFIMPFIQTYFY